MYILHNWVPYDKIDWETLSSNQNAISLLENNLDKNDWSNLSRNENAVRLLENNLDNMILFCYINMFSINYIN
jgi:hypothetical protein